MSVFGHLTAYRSALFVELGLRGLFAFVCGWVVHFRAKVYCVEACRKIDHRVIEISDKVLYGTCLVHVINVVAHGIVNVNYGESD